MPDTIDLQNEIAEMRRERDKARAEGQTAHAAAQQVLADEKGKGFKLADTSDEATESFGRIDAAFKLADEHNERAAELDRRIGRLLDDASDTAADEAQGDPTHPTVLRAMNLGAIAVASDEYAAMLASGELQIQDNSRATAFAPITLTNHREAARFLATGHFRADAGDGSPLVPTHEELDPIMMPREPLSILNLITVAPTQREAVTYVEQTARTTAGTMLKPFGTAFDPSRYTFQRVTVPVLRKGHYAVVDEGNISDADEFGSIVNGELTTDLREVIETDVMSANGGGDWTGFYNRAGITDYDATDETIADAFHKAMTALRIALGTEPTAYGVDPLTFEQFWLEKGSDGHYVHHQGSAMAPRQTIWGKPAVVNTRFTIPCVADWRRAGKLWVNEGVTVAVGRINQQFIEGLWSIRAQTRSGFACVQPKAFAKISNLGVTTP